MIFFNSSVLYILKRFISRLRKSDDMICLLVSDLDGTLLTDDKNVSKADQIALLKLKEAGVHICLATGRNKAEIVGKM
jgi:predicted mannosyl-3-phosphoglycerate phosphatase (HAD superfamily)